MTRPTAGLDQIMRGILLSTARQMRQAACTTALMGLTLAGFASAPALAQKQAPARAPARGAAASAAALDVKAGVDAWSRGDHALAIRIWQPFADKGDADAQFNLGQAYRQGIGVTQDLQRAEVFYAKAAAQGHLRAADNYGLLLFQRGQHNAALPYVRDAADRGDPRALYLMGLAYFNAEGVGKDWVRAYALESLAAQPMSGGPGLPQAREALAQMDKYIELQDRQRGISLATELAAQIEANRNRQLAANDLGTMRRPPVGASLPSGMAGMPTAPAPMTREAAPAPVTAPEPAPAPAPRATDDLPPAVARPAPKPVAQPVLAKPVLAKPVPVKPAPTPAVPALPAAAKPAPASFAKGSWKIQLGAFGVASNADALWAKLKSRAEIAGHARQDAASGKVTRLLATGYSEEAAKSACRSLAGAGVNCLAVKD